MDERRFLEVLSGERRGIGASVLRSVCTVGSWGYAAGVALRNAAFDHGWRRIHRVDAPVISVGNVTTGGTGKTPVVAWLANRLSQHGHRPAIVSRGYRSLDGLENDEARVLGRLCPHAVRIQNRDRVVGARTAITDHGCDAIVLDDGFQHRRLHRDLDIVLVDALQPWGFPSVCHGRVGRADAENGLSAHTADTAVARKPLDTGCGRLLPRGLLREPLWALKRADVVIITRADQVTAEHLADMRIELVHNGAPAKIATVGFTPQRLIQPDGTALPLSHLDGRRIAAFCGLGNPLGFFDTVSRWQPIAAGRVFPDHHHYSAGDFACLAEWRKSINADLLVTTLKDLVKIPADTPLGNHVVAVDIGVEFLSGRDHVEDLITRTVTRPTHRCAA